MCNKSIEDEFIEACFGSIMDEEIERQKWLNDLDEGPNFVSRHRRYRSAYTVTDEQSDIIEELVDDLALEGLPHIQKSSWKDIAKGE